MSKAGFIVLDFGTDMVTKKKKIWKLTLDVFHLVTNIPPKSIK